MSPASAPHFSVAPVGRRARTPGAMARKKGKARPGGSASAPVPPGEDAPPPDAAATDRGDADPAGDGAVVSPAVPPSPAAVDVDAPPDAGVSFPSTWRQNVSMTDGGASERSRRMAV